MGTNLCRQLSLKQQDFEIIDLKMSNQFPEKCKIADVRDVESLRAAITGDVVVMGVIRCSFFFTHVLSPFCVETLKWRIRDS